LSIRLIGLIAFAVVLTAAVFLFIPPLPQDPAYYDFSDARRLLGIANFWNVVSNLPFLAIGAVGLAYVNRYSNSVCVAGLETACMVFFAGILLTAFGSAYFHLAPGNATLVWDRLPMTIGFGALITIIVGECVSVSAARHLLIPMLLLGFGSVEYWAWTEARGAGDLRPYAIVQFLPMLIIPIILSGCRHAHGSTRYYWWMILFYFLAKLLEYFDDKIFNLGHLISGHSLKHVVAAAAPAVFLYALSRRR
jgi:hypothetical protein